MRALVALVLLAACGDDGGSGGGGNDGGGGDDAPPSDGDVPLDSNLPGARSAGCGMASATTPAMFGKRTVTVAGTARDLWVRTPTNYDPSRAYPVIYQLHGCSSQPTRETNNVPVENQVGDNAIVVRARAAADCWDSNPNNADVAYVDAMMTDVEGSFCVNTDRRFLAGYSSGSFMTNQLSCIRGDKFRGAVTIAGGPGSNACTGSPAALLIHDLNDTTVAIGQGTAARDAYLTRNGCDSPATSTPTATPPCVQYAGCEKPVVWCQTSGQNHSRQDGVAGPLFWSFIQSLL